MTAKALRQRVERLQPSATRPYVLYREEGETDMEVTHRAAGLGYPSSSRPGPTRPLRSGCRNAAGPRGVGNESA